MTSEWGCCPGATEGDLRSVPTSVAALRPAERAVLLTALCRAVPVVLLRLAAQAERRDSVAGVDRVESRAERAA